MASPVDAGRIATNVSTAVDPFPVTLPGSIVAGDLLISFIRFAANITIVSYTGWTLILEDAGDASDDRTLIVYRVATGSDALSVDLSTTAKGAAITWRITGAENPATQAPQFGTVAYNTTVANTCDPGSAAPTGGSKDYLFLALGGGDQEVGAFTASPTNYSAITAGDQRYRRHRRHERHYRRRLEAAHRIV